MELKDIIKIRRDALGLTLQEIADYVGVSKPTIQRYESGEIVNLKQGMIYKLSQVLKISPAKLMGWENPEEAVSSLIKDRLEEIGMSLEDAAKNSGVSLHWLQNIDIFTPGDCGDDEIGYYWITQVAEVIGLPSGLLRAALARQEIPLYESPYENTLEDARKWFSEPYFDTNNCNSISTSFSRTEQEYIKKYRDLDTHGREMVDFTLLKEWERSSKSDGKHNEIVEIPKYSNLNAAHARTDIEITDEMKQHDDDIMDDKNF